MNLVDDERARALAELWFCLFVGELESAARWIDTDADGEISFSSRSSGGDVRELGRLRLRGATVPQLVVAKDEPACRVLVDEARIGSFFSAERVAKETFLVEGDAPLFEKGLVAIESKPKRKSWLEMRTTR